MMMRCVEMMICLNIWRDDDEVYGDDDEVCGDDDVSKYMER